jgi:hypothetical protein
MIADKLLRSALGEAVKLGQMTREDATQLTDVVLQIASRQARDTLTQLEPLLAPALRSAGWAQRTALGKRPR